MRAVTVVGMMILGWAFAGQPARATDSPADPCSLLTAAQVSSTLGDKYGAPEKSALTNGPKIPPIELLEVCRGNRLDFGATGQAIGRDQAMATVGAVHGTEDVER